MNTPQAVPVAALADYYWKTGELLRHNPRVNEFGLPPRQFRAFQIEVAQRLLAHHDYERAWLWIESIDSLLDDVPGRPCCRAWNIQAGTVQLRSGKRARARFGRWRAMAEFFMRRAESTASDASAGATRPALTNCIPDRFRLQSLRRKTSPIG